jgi:hypothetical protein
MQQAAALHRESSQAARVFTEFTYQTTISWSRSPRVVAKDEHIEGKENPRMVLRAWRHGEPHQGTVFLVCWARERRYHASQSMRLYLSAAAYVLMSAFRRLALSGTVWARAQCETIRLQLLRIGAHVPITARKVWISIASSYPYWRVFAQAYEQLRR